MSYSGQKCPARDTDVLFWTLIIGHRTSSIEWEIKKKSRVTFINIWMIDLFDATWICGCFLCTIVCVIKLHLEWQLVFSHAANYRCHSNSRPPHRVRNRWKHLSVVFFFSKVTQWRKYLQRIKILVRFVMKKPMN